MKTNSIDCVKIKSIHIMDMVLANKRIISINIMSNTPKTNKRSYFTFRVVIMSRCFNNAWYHTVLNQIGISIGVNALSSNRINLIDYTYPTTEAILSNINDIRNEISTPYIVNLMITPGHGAPQLSGQEIPRTIITLKSNLCQLRSTKLNIC
jgi:hypothetical protein